MAMSLILFTTGNMNTPGDSGMTMFGTNPNHQGQNSNLGAAVHSSSSTFPSRISELLNGFLAFFALFRGGRHPYLKPYIKVMNDLVSGIDDDIEEVNPEFNMS